MVLKITILACSHYLICTLEKTQVFRLRRFTVKKCFLSHYAPENHYTIVVPLINNTSKAPLRRIEKYAVFNPCTSDKQNSPSRSSTEPRKFNLCRASRYPHSKSVLQVRRRTESRCIASQLRKMMSTTVREGNRHQNREFIYSYHDTSNARSYVEHSGAKRYTSKSAW